MAVKPVKVSQLNGYIKRVLLSDPLLGNVSVIGEISNLTFHSSGHIYFSLKDETSKLNCFLPSEQRRQLRYELAEGMEVIAAGYINVFERGGTYSLNIRDIEVEGAGNLSAAYNKLKSKLEKEGLFDEKYKKPIPVFPEQIAVITSETGAAVRDIIKIIKSRNDITNIIVYPCLVQGPDAAADIARAISEVNSLFPETDTIIVGRGGGSMEELWAFNEEIVARSIFLSDIPVISAVGHETDFTIADFVADRRAATPTEAAQMAVPDTAALRDHIEKTRDGLRSSVNRVIQYMELRTVRHNIQSLYRQLSDRLSYSFINTEKLCNELSYNIEEKLIIYGNRLQQLKTELTAANPYEIMKRGYGAILNTKGKLVSTVEAFAPADSLTVIFNDGKIKCIVDEIRRNSDEHK